MLTVIDSSPKAIAARLDYAERLAANLSPARQRDALVNWLAVARRGSVSKNDLGPAIFGRTLQFVALVEILDDGTDYRYLIEGREVIRWFGKSGSIPFGSLYSPEHLACLQSFYLTVQLAGRPNIHNFMVRSIEDEELAFSQLVLPATDNSGVVRYFAIVFDFPDPMRRIPAAPLRMYSPWMQLRKGTAKDTIPGDYNWR